MYHSLASATFSGTTYIHLKIGAPTSAADIVQALDHVEVRAIFVYPSIVEEIGRSPRILEQLSAKLDTICFAGWALQESIGDVVAPRIKLINLYGSTEMGQGVQLTSMAAGQDWLYHCWNETLMGMSFREETKDVYQMVIAKGFGQEEFQTPFTLFRDIREYATKDLFSPHPSISHLWRHCGRSDDLIVL